VINEYVGLAYKLLVIVGVGLLLYSLRTATLIIAELPVGKNSKRWRVLRGMIVFFIIGYVSHAVFAPGEELSLPATITSMVFFFGACFVVMVNFLSLQSVKDVKRITALEAECITDPLTGIYNRRGFFALAEQQLKMANRQKAGIYMLYADVDNMKSINDTYGHKEGDRALIETANILKENYRDSDIIGRLGGDEFVVVPIGTAGADLEKITARLQRALDIHNEKVGRGYRLSVSVGTAYYDPEHPRSVDELLGEADRLMYERKGLKRKPA
jgi:diguanylate cyclase (GGDEF)-like protein